jgi:hypothetical protein
MFFPLMMKSAFRDQLVLEFFRSALPKNTFLYVDTMPISVVDKNRLKKRLLQNIGKQEETSKKSHESPSIS